VEAGWGDKKAFNKYWGNLTPVQKKVRTRQLPYFLSYLTFFLMQAETENKVSYLIAIPVCAIAYAVDSQKSELARAPK
jgi:hypothetical protein